MTIADRMQRALGDVATLTQDERLPKETRAELRCAFNILMLVRLPNNVAENTDDQVLA